VAVVVVSRKRLLMTGAGLVLFVVAILLVVLPFSASAADPEDELQCATDRRIVTDIDYDENVVDKREPRILAADWRERMSGPRRNEMVSRQEYNPSLSEMKIGYSDRSGNMVAVLRFEKRGPSWRLDSVVECA
jgi:hypothetical protein